MSLTFDTSLTGVRAGEIMLATTQNNVANASNTSYARQRADLVAVGIPQGNMGVQAQLGTGVEVQGIDRMVNELLIQQTRSENGQIGYYDTKSETLTSVETIFSETSDYSLSELFDNFFSGFQEASKYPELSSYRVSTLYDAKMLAEKANSISTQINTIKEQTDYEIETEITSVNQLLNKIGDINNKLNKVPADNVNALLDERDTYLDQLSEHLDITVIQGSSDSKIDIKAGNTTILSGVEVYEVKGFYDREEDTWTLGATDSVLQSASGSLTALVELRNNDIRKYEDDLNNFFNAFIGEVNTLHSAGYGLDNSTGLDLFLGTNISSIKVNDFLFDNPEKLGLSSVIGITGNVEISNAIADLSNKPFYYGKTPVNYYQEYTVGFAADLNTLNTNLNIHNTTYASMESQRQSIQGVNIDEEMTNLMSIQKYYQANSKALSTTDDLLDKLLEII